MRQRNPKTKKLRSVEIPEELRSSICEALEYIRQAEHDPDLPVDFGDAIQVGAICGGRIGAVAEPVEGEQPGDGSVQSRTERALPRFSGSRWRLEKTSRFGGRVLGGPRLDAASKSDRLRADRPASSELRPLPAGVRA